VTVYAVPAEQPVATLRCPVHNRQVAYENGVLAGRCDQCSAEAAQGLAWLKKHPRKRRYERNL
jgi:hypothetical protein